jgi:hypothetical protein
MPHFALQMTLTPEYNRKETIHSSCFINNHLGKGAMYILKRVLNSLKHLVTLDFQWLHSGLTRWTKLLNTSLVPGIVTDLFRSTKQALFIVQPETLLRGPREGFRFFWKQKSKMTSHPPKVAPETISLEPIPLGLQPHATQYKRAFAGARCQVGSLGGIRGQHLSQLLLHPFSPGNWLQQLCPWP